MGDPSCRRVSYDQLEHLWEFLNKRKDLATGHNKTTQARELSRKMWEEITRNLNSHVGGAVKDWKGWCKYWNDYKYKLKKNSEANVSQRKSGGDNYTIRGITDIEKKFLQIIRHDFSYELEPDNCSPTSFTHVKVEPFEEDIEIEDTEITAATSSERALADVDSKPIPLDINAPGPSIPSSADLDQRGFASHPRSPPNIPTTRNTHATISRPRIMRRSLHHRRNLDPFLPSNSSPQSPTSPRPEAERRRRPFRRRPQLAIEQICRAFVAESQKQTRIEEQKLKIMTSLLSEFREFKEICRLRFNPTDDI